MTASRNIHRWPAPAFDGGFTLIEVLVATLMALVVFAAVLSGLESSQRVQAADTEYALTLQEGRTGLARMARDLRQAYKVEEAKANMILFLATIGGKTWQIKYECNIVQTGALDQCERFAAEKGNTLGVGVPVIREVANGSEVFAYSPSASAPTVVTMKLELPAGGTLKQAGSSGYQHKVVLENSAYMRNLYLEG